MHVHGVQEVILESRLVGGSPEAKGLDTLPEMNGSLPWGFVILLDLGEGEVLILGASEAIQGFILRGSQVEEDERA